MTEKVSFNIASEASYVYILSGQKFNKNAKNGPIWRVFENLKLAVKQSYQKGQWKMPKFKNSNATFWVIFKHCVHETICIAWNIELQSYIFVSHVGK